MQKNLTQLFKSLLYKKCIVLILILTTFSNSIKAQYCTTSTGTLSELIGNVNFAGINNTSTASVAYEDFTAVVGNIFQGATAPITITLALPFNQDQVIVWIDYNNNGLFTDAGEQVFISAVGVGPFSGSVTVPLATPVGPKRMRVRLHDTSSGPNTTPCGAAGWGQVEDYTINVVSNAPCTGTPAPGNPLSNVTTACLGSPFTLSVQNSTGGTGVTYLWQSGTSATGPWSTAAGAATNSTYVGVMATALFYRCVVTCAANSGNSNPVQVALTPASACYCASTATNIADEDIFNVTLGTLNNTSNCTTVAPGFGSAAALYSNFTSGTGAPAAPNVIAGGSNPISIQIGTCSAGSFSNLTAVWIDLNQNGAFEASERLYISPAAVAGAHLETGSLVIPANATLGITRMRVQVREFGTPANMLPCTNMAWGEVEDYNVNIVPCVAVAITTQPTNAAATCGGTATFTTAATGSIPGYAWQYRTSATGSWLPVPNAAPYSNVNTAILSVATNSSLNGYQFRGQVSGACSAVDFTNPATLTVNALVLNVTPSSGNICSTGGTPLLLSVPNSTQTVTVSSSLGAGFAIPDGPAGAGPVPGVNTPLIISGIPVGANILDISVKLNITHTYVGDLIINLKSPSSTATTGIINLVGFLNAGAGNNATPNFTNTVVSSNGITVMSGAAAPRTGTFKADGFITTSPPLAANFPSNGGAANVANWSTLLSAPNANGNWVLYLADGGAGDVGTLLDWSISITYGAAPATAVFTPAAGLFTNALGTIPYVAGTAVGQVYASPTATSTYSAVVTTGLCSTASQNILVNVNNAPAGTLAVAPVTACESQAAAFAFTGLTGGTGLTYQWQMSTLAAPTFANIAGATSATYTIPSVTNAMNGNSYRVLVSASGCVATTTLTSTASLLTVNPTPIVTISASPVTSLFPGLTSTLTAAVSPNAAVSYQWFKNNVAVTAPLPSNNYVVNIDGLGSYSVKVIDIKGCSNTLTTPANILIKDSATNNVMFIYPSPNTGRFQVRYFFNTNATGTFVNIYDEKGARVFTRGFAPGLGYGQMNVDLGTHGRGVYRVDLLDGNGNRLKTGSVMVF